jgi:hypothetical protein
MFTPPPETIAAADPPPDNAPVMLAGFDSLLPRVERWSRWLDGHGLTGFAAALLDVVVPLAPLGAQALYFLQPALGLLVPRQAVSELAELLDTPGGAAWLRDALDP